MTVQEAAAALRARQLSAVELTAQSLAAVERLQPHLNAFITVTESLALERARAADASLAAGEDLGPLHGIPVAVKDMYCTRGVRTTCGSALFADHVPDHDAAVVESLARAGAVPLGKLNMHELAYGITSNNPHFGAVRNPCDTTCIPGGSSGGAGAAVASEMVFLAMGSDTGGSIRIPASYCGTVGLKPTFGRVSRYGTMPLDFSLDHMGPLARTVRDTAIGLAAVAGHDKRDDTSSRRAVDAYVPPIGCSIAGLRVGVPENFYFSRLEPEVAAALYKALGRAAMLGAQVVPLRVPDMEAVNAVGRLILLVEASAAMEPYLGERGRFGTDVLALLDQGRLLPATDYVNAQRLRRTMQGEFRQVWERVDCLFTPTTPNTAPRVGQTAVTIGGEEEDVRLAATRLVRGLNVLGLPALSLPCGTDARGLPVGLQIVGPAFSEARLLRTGAALEDSGL